MLKFAPRVKETTTTSGTGTYSLGGAQTGFQTFVSGIGSTNSCYYTVEDGTNWETGVGTVTSGAPDTLSRDLVINSSNGNAAVSWSGATKNVWLDMPERAKCILHRSTALNIPQGTKVSWDSTAYYDPLGMFSNSHADRVTIVYPGPYRIRGVIRVQQTTQNFAEYILYRKNAGGTILEKAVCDNVNTPAAALQAFAFHWAAVFNSTDYIEITLDEGLTSVDVDTAFSSSENWIEVSQE